MKTKERKQTKPHGKNTMTNESITAGFLCGVTTQRLERCQFNCCIFTRQASGVASHSGTTASCRCS